MLRSRVKADDNPGQLPGLDLENQWSYRGSTRFRRIGCSRMRICWAIVLFLVVVSVDRLNRWRVRGRDLFSASAQYRHQGETPAQDDAIKTWNSTWRYPLVDRMILHELDQLQYFASNHSSDDQLQRRPLVTRLPEEASRSRNVDDEITFSRVAKEGICETPTHPRPCRFLFPVRIAEQESKARIHFFQLAQLANRLNRTLVLPKVGKSKIGACFKWNFQTYYNRDSLNLALGDPLAHVEQEDFQAWLEDTERRLSPPTTQLFAVGPSLDPQETLERELSSDKHDGIRVYDFEPYEGWRNDIPSCLTKSRWLEDLHPSFMTVAQRTRGGLHLSSESMAMALSDESLSIRSGNAVTQILMLDWNLRYPLSTLSHRQQLGYSQSLVNLAKRLAPSSPYLVVHWRMETVDPSVLSDCAHALVDLLVRLLHDESMALNISTVWFASDYPYPIAGRTKTQPRFALGAKSGTFREFEIRHERAVQVLREAFEEGGELGRWEVTDISEATESYVIDKELSNDAGILGIVDKLIAMQADLFLSGSNRCARRRYGFISLRLKRATD